MITFLYVLNEEIRRLAVAVCDCEVELDLLLLCCSCGYSTSAMENSLTEEQQREFTEAFYDLDKQKTGYLSPRELNVLMRSLGHSLTEEDKRNLTSDTERCVSLNDFLSIMAKHEQDVALQDKLSKGFSVFDRDGSGFISTDELRQQMMSVGPAPYTEAEFEAFMSEYIAKAPMESNPIAHPASEDGLMDYQEFIKLMLAK